MISFSEFILRFLDEWNVEAGYLAEDLYVARHSVDAWMYRRRIPNSDNIKIMQNYFGEEFKNVVFDGKVFRRKFKIIRPDGSSQVYDTMGELGEVEGVDMNTIKRTWENDNKVQKGRSKGCRFERVYEEVGAE